MKLKRLFSIAAALSSLVIVAMILYTNETIQDMTRFTENNDFSPTTRSFTIIQHKEVQLESHSFISRKQSNAFLETWPPLLRLAIPGPATVM